VIVSDHARRQAAQRSVSHEDIEWVLANGLVSHQHNKRLLYYCGRSTDRSTARNLAVVVAQDGAVITVIRTSSLKKLRAKVSRGHAFHAV